MATVKQAGRYDAILSQINALQIRKQSLEAKVAHSFEDERYARISAIEANPNERSDSTGARSADSPVGWQR
jgi:hypothetical protein